MQFLLLKREGKVNLCHCAVFNLSSDFKCTILFLSFLFLTRKISFLNRKDCNVTISQINP